VKQVAAVITSVDFVSIDVADQERAKRFYIEVLGFEELRDVPMGDPDGPRWIEVRPRHAHTKVVLFHNPDGAGKFGPCVFDTDDIVQTAKDIQAAGGEILEQPAMAPWGSWWGRFRDCEGNELGMSQRGPDGR
jgi:predicted enzyme related to lactoylglutathione lyase